MLLRALVLLLSTIAVCWPQWSLPDWHGTEGRRVQIATEMAKSGDWLVPTLGQQPTWAKPPLHYWLLESCGELFGWGFLALRLPAVLGHWLLAVLAMVLLTRSFGTAAGWVGALGVLLSPVLLLEMPTAEIDPLFAVLTTASVWCLAAGVARDRAALVLASGVLGGLAFLQKGAPYFLFAVGAWLVWARHRRLRYWWWHFLPLLALPLAYYSLLLSTRTSAAELAAVLNDETVGRIHTFQWRHVLKTPEFWLRAAAVQLPFGLWCFWEWRGRRDARMDGNDLMLRMCSGGAVLAVVLLTFFPGRPTRYLLPNVPLFTFAVAPAVAHFAAQQRELGAIGRRVLRACGVAGAIVLIVLPWLPSPAGASAAAAALAVALLPWLLRTPRQLVAACLWLPVLMVWTVGAARVDDWPMSNDARLRFGGMLAAEVAAVNAPLPVPRLATWGHFQSAVLLGMGLPEVPAGDEPPSGATMPRRPPTAPFVLHEEAVGTPPGYDTRLRFFAPWQTFSLAQRRDGR